MRPRIIDRRAIAERGVPAMRVIPALEPLKHRHPGFDLASEAPAIEQLTFQRSEEALGHRVVVSIPDRSHGRHEPGFLAALAEGVAGVLAAAVGAVEDCVLSPWLCNDHLKVPGQLQDPTSTSMKPVPPNIPISAPICPTIGSKTARGPIVSNPCDA